MSKKLKKTRARSAAKTQASSKRLEGEDVGGEKNITPAQTTATPHDCNGKTEGRRGRLVLKSGIPTRPQVLPMSPKKPFASITKTAVRITETQGEQRGREANRQSEKNLQEEGPPHPPTATAGKRSRCKGRRDAGKRDSAATSKGRGGARLKKKKRLSPSPYFLLPAPPAFPPGSCRQKGKKRKMAVLSAASPPTSSPRR